MEKVHIRAFLSCVTLPVKAAAAMGAENRACENIGQRVQNSVFECELAPAQLVDIRNKLLKIIDNESDSLRIYHMGSNWHHKIEQLGKEKSFDISGPLII